MFFSIQDSPSKRRKRAKKAKPLHCVFPDEFAATQECSDKQLQAVERFTAIVDYVKKTLNELKVSPVAIRCVL